MKVIIIGAVAAGTSAATKIRRNNESAEVVIYERDQYISYSGCGMPYFIGNQIKSLDELNPRDPDFFKSKHNIDILTRHQVLEINPKEQYVKVKNLTSGFVFKDEYDKLVIATGAMPIKPEITGIDHPHVFFLRNLNDVNAIKQYVEQYLPKKAVVIGTGFIGFEVLENLTNLEIDVTMIEKDQQITPNLDADMACYLENKLIEKNVKIIKNTQVTKIDYESVTLIDESKVMAELVIIAIGVQPNTILAKNAGIKLGFKDAIKVNSKMKTSSKNIYAAGDCIETFSSITNKPVYQPLGSTANKTGRIAGDVISGGNLEYKGNLSTSIFQVFDLTVATTGLNEKQAIEHGYDIQICHNIKLDKPEYMYGKEMLIKAIASKTDGRLLGVQIIGFNGVDKRIDVFATLITYKATVDQLFELDLAYAPPFSTTKDAIHYTGMILDNAINSNRKIIDPRYLDQNKANYHIIDARTIEDCQAKGLIPTAIHVSQPNLRKVDLKIGKDDFIVTYCNKGVTANAAQNILLNQGYKNVWNLSGGQTVWKNVIKTIHDFNGLKPTEKKLSSHLPAVDDLIDYFNNRRDSIYDAQKFILMDDMTNTMSFVKEKTKLGVFSMASDLGKKFRHRVIETEKFLTSKNFDVTLGYLHNQSIGYTSGTIKERAYEFNGLIEENQVLMSMIGGLNSSSVLKLIDYDLLKQKKPKVVGYSDTTALLLAIYNKTNLPVYYGPSFLASFYEMDYIRDWNFNSFLEFVIYDTKNKIIPTPAKWTQQRIDWSKKNIAIKKLKKNQLISFNDGIVQGRIIGGNLDALISIYHTEFMPEIKKGDILFIEDAIITIDQCERNFAFLINNGIIDKLAGIILGKCEAFDAKKTKETYYSLFMKIINPTVPVLAQFDLGHTQPMNVIKIGATIEMDTLDKTIKYID